MIQTGGDQQRVLRVLARPYKNTAEPGQGRVYDEMVANGHVVEELSLAKLVRQRWDVVHIHYPEGALRRPGLVVSVVGVLVLAAIVVVSRLKGTVIVSTGHNTQSHEQHHPRLERLTVSAFDRAVGAMTFPSQTAERVVVERRPRLGRVPSEVVPLTNYRWERQSVTQGEARKAWDLPSDATVILFLGLVRSYKNVPALIEAVRDAGTDDVVLVVAGSPASEELELQVRDAADDDLRVRLELRYIEAEEVSTLMGAADLVVLPFSAVLNSASTLLAVSHDKPVMVPETGSLGELAQRAGAEWFFFFEGEITGEKITATLVSLDDRRASLEQQCPDLSWCDVETVAEQTTNFYAGLIA